MTRTIVDLSESKNPIEVPDEQELALNRELLGEIEDNIEHLEAIAEAMGENKHYIEIVSQSYIRLKDIAFKSMDIDVNSPTFMTDYCKVRGQYGERLLLTSELMNVREHIKNAEAARDDKATWIDKVTEQLQRVNPLAKHKAKEE